MSDMPLRTLVLAGTAESRAVIHALSDEPSVQLTASLAGATPNPAGLPAVSYTHLTLPTIALV